MRKILPLFSIAFLFILTGNEYTAQKLPNQRELFGRYVAEHPFAKMRLTAEQLADIPKKDRPDLAWQQDFLTTMDPALGRPARERLIPVLQQIDHQKNSLMATPGASGTPWVERGPDNVGGRTRAIMWDPNATSGNKVWAGGVTGGLWYNNDITSSTSQWQAANNFWDNISITAIASDPNNSQIFYVGTGEGWGAGAARGAGIWKTTDGGTTFSQLSSTSTFYYVNDLVVRNAGGSSVVYAACRGNFYRGQFHGSASNGLQRSTNGGTSWTQVLPNVSGQTINYAAADIEIAADNRIWVGTTTSSFGAADRGGGRVLYSDNGTTWTVSRTVANAERVEVACAPNDANYVYAIFEVSNQAGEISRTTNKGTSWTVRNEPNDADPGIPSTDFTRGQAWYDLIIAVNPTDKDEIYVGGIDLFRSTNGGTSWSQLSHWYGGFGFTEVHADQHQIVFKPGSSTEVLFGHDGGVTRSTNITANTPTFSNRNNGYNVTQFYAGAMHPTAGQNYFLAGAQDNGTQRFTSAGINSTTEATGGDGAFCFIDQTNSNLQITSFVYNSYWRSTNGGVSFGSRFQSDQTTGRFINPADYDDQQNILYSARTSSTINRVTNMNTSPSIGSFTVSGMNSMASHLRVSPYTTSSTTLYVGTGNGNLYKITNADGSSPSASNIGSNSFPSGSISCVELGASENEILVTFSNYGVTSVWYTSNGGTSWTSKEGNLPDMPVRWALFNPNDRNEVILATEVGIWSTSNFNNSNPGWSSSSNGMANVRVDMLQIRDSDDEVMAATHGRGLFTSSGFSASAPPTASFAASRSRACTGQTVALNDSSTGGPTSWQWSISPSTFSFVNGTSASSQNPEVQFSATGSYTVTLTVSNANGSNSSTETVDVGGFGLPFTEDFEGATDFRVDNPDMGTTWTLFNIGGTSPGMRAAGIDLYNYTTTGERDGLLSPVLDFSGFSSVTLDFEYAYRRYSNANRDSMAIFVSTDCGATYTRVASYKSDASNNFATGADLTTAFTPSVSSDWCGNTTIPNCPSINLNAYAGQSEVIIKWEAINGYGNNLYIDNINVTGSGVVVVAPVADFSTNNTSPCENNSVSFTDASANTPSSWQWSFAPNTVTYVNGTSATSQNPEVQFNASGAYQVSLTSTNSAGSNTEVKSSYINVTPAVVPSVSLVASKNNICQGELIIFTATATNGGPNPSYQWKVNGANVTNSGRVYGNGSLQNGDVVSVEVTSNAVCASPMPVGSNPITAVVSPIPTVSLSVTVPVANLCKEDTVVLTGTPAGGAYSGPGVSGNSFVAAQAGDGSHWVTYNYTNSGGCSAADSVMLNVDIVPVPTVSQTGNTLVCNESGFSYQWLLNGTPAPGNSTAQTYAVTANGNYRVQIGTGSCFDVSADFNVNNFSQEDMQRIYGFEAYPNPATDRLSINFINPGAATASVELYDLKGALVQSQQIKGSKFFNAVLNVHSLSAGIYALKVSCGEMVFTKKINKQ